MGKTVAEREAQWGAFLSRWPLEKLHEMTLEQYSQAGNQNCFVYWLEAKTEDLGSIWGGSAFKFGIYSRRDTSQKQLEGTRFYSSDYAWYSKYGNTPETAFATIKGIILAVAAAARVGELASIDTADLGTAVKWKLAFLYQNRSAPSVLPIFKTEYLQAALNSTEKRASVMHSQLLSQRSWATEAAENDTMLFSYADEIWPRIEAQYKTELAPKMAKQYFDSAERFTLIKPATQKIAGYTTSTGAQLALSLDNQKTTIYLNSGQWIEGIRDRLQEIVEYAPDKSRNSNIASNAPNLALGQAITKVVVPDMEALIGLCDAYDDSTDITQPPIQITAMKPASFPKPPLNQILFGPPGTGKTHATIEAALEVLDPVFLQANLTNRISLKARFDELVSAGSIRFVTFHQSFSYEDFVEGLRAESDESNQLSYEIVDGLFKTLCVAASAKVTHQEAAPLDLSGRKIWKMSLGNSLGDDAYVYDECTEQGYALLGYGAQLDFGTCMTRQQVLDLLVDSNQAINNDSYEVTAVNAFVNKMSKGDLVVVTEGNLKFRAIGEITGDYRVINRDEQGDNYTQCRNVKWLRVYKPSLPYDQLMNNKFSQMTIYELKHNAIDMDKLAGLLQANAPCPPNTSPPTPFVSGEQFGSGYTVVRATPDLLELKKPNEKSLPLGMGLLQTLAEYVRNDQLTLEDIREKRVFEKLPSSRLEPYIVNGYNNILPHLVERLVKPSSTEENGQLERTASMDDKVLIIDEINRGNVSRIFGELITLIEPSKRAEQPEALEVMLPYSKKPFSVPSNLYLIGTMNTADRSLAGLDIALRRRFTFREMPPKPEILSTVEVQGVNIGQLLRVMNDRIEALLDRDHCLGHAYFMTLKEHDSLEELASIFKSKLIPLLQEYFFEDWQRIQWVLNDHRKPKSDRFILMQNLDTTALFGDGVAVNDQGGTWKVNDESFSRIEAYRGIISAAQRDESE